jgi:sensor histidine kinase YesM
VRWAQALTLVAWVLLTPILLRVRRRLRARGAIDDDGNWLTVREIAGHLGVVATLIALHAAVLVVLGLVIGAPDLIFLGPLPPVAKLWVAVVSSYGLFDLLTYIAILALAHATDRARQAEEVRRRAAALEATAVTARLAALRARLDPHFLYNALNAAVTLARRGHGEDTSRVLEELTALLRYVLDESRSSVALSEELAFVRRYLDIMQLRFGARLTYSIRVDADVTDAPVPPLILQPLVENAVEHGVANATGPVAVRVSARRGSDGLVIVVEDDGPGPNAVARVGTGIGLGATRERLAMLFGESAGLTFGPRAPRGAVTELTIPIASASSA